MSTLKWHGIHLLLDYVFECRMKAGRGDNCLGDTLERNGIVLPKNDCIAFLEGKI